MSLFFFFRPPVLRDLESLEPAFYNSLVWIQENDPEPLDLTFTIEEEAFDQVSERMKPVPTPYDITCTLLLPPFLS